jgi:hypothetical protein
MVVGGGIVGWLPSFDLQPNFQGKAFEHHAYSSWSSSVECGAWSFTLLHDALQCPISDDDGNHHHHHRRQVMIQ